MNILNSQTNETTNNFDPNIYDFIDGQKLELNSIEGFRKYSPRDGSLLYTLHPGETKRVDMAVANAKEAFDDGRWSNLPVRERARILNRLADLIEVKFDHFAYLESLDAGKPITAALTDDLPTTLSELRYYAHGADNIFSKHHFTDHRKISYEHRRPLGVVGAIIGWNFPLLLAITKIGPALAMGNTLVLKPSALTSLSACRVAELAIEAGVPPGVLNVVHGSGAVVGSTLSHHRDIKLLTFTGSSVIGREIMVAAGNSNMKRVLLECGGKSPNIVFNDCPEDLNAVADEVIISAFRNQGQVCIAGSRLLLQEGIKARLLPIFLERLAALRPGDPLDPNTRFGPVVSHEQLRKVMNYIDYGKRQGAKLIHGGNRVQLELDGFYVEPTVFDDVALDHAIAQEEIFGPVLSVFSFRDEQEALKIANSTPYGLAASVWTQNLGRAQRMAHGIEAGFIEIRATTAPHDDDAPFSVEGHKQSGFGKEGGMEGLLSYSAVSTVDIRI